jgi:streptogramin lyase
MSASISPRGLWATTYYGGVVVRIDPMKAKVVRKLHVLGNASGVTYARGSVWVSDAALGRVDRIDPTRGKIVKSYSVGITPRDLVRVGRGLWSSSRGRTTSACSRCPTPPRLSAAS